MPETPPELAPGFARNLRAIAFRQPQLAKRLCRPAGDDHLVGNPPALQLHRSRIPLALSPAQVERALPAEAGATIFVFGVGLGELVQGVLDAFPDATVVAWDRDPVMIRMAFERFDFSDAVERGRLVFALGADLLDWTPRIGVKMAYHPLLRQVYRWCADLVLRPASGRRALVCAGGLFVDDVAEALTQEGLGVYIWDIHRLGQEELQNICARVEPEFVFAINHSHGLAEACGAQDVPLVVWEIDPATDGLLPAGAAMNHVSIHTYRESNVERFRAAGFPHVNYTPLAANTVRRSPGSGSYPSGPELCFVGASMVDQAHRFKQTFLDAWTSHFGGQEGARIQGEKMLDAILAAQRSRPREYVIPQLLQRHLERFIDAVTPQLADDPVAMVAEMAAAERRLNVIARLGGAGIHVWGDPGWKLTVPAGVVYKGFAGHNQQLTNIYRRGKIHVDVNRLYQLDIVPMRIFDILACGGFVIAEHSPALEQLFEVGVEIEAWRTIEELVAKVEFFRANPDKGAAIAARGLEAVRERHTIRGRVQEMISDLPVKCERSSAG
jgi:spore maturation protein CgeB